MINLEEYNLIYEGKIYDAISMRPIDGAPIKEYKTEDNKEFKCLYEVIFLGDDNRIKTFHINQEDFQLIKK